MPGSANIMFEIDGGLNNDQPEQYIGYPELSMGRDKMSAINGKRFSSGWNYWFLYILVSMSELTAIGVYVQFWWPEIPLWHPAYSFFIVVNALNLASVKVYGEAEFWFSIIKVLAIVAMIIFGTYLLFSGSGGEQGICKRSMDERGFFPKGWLSEDGLELIGITAWQKLKIRRKIFEGNQSGDLPHLDFLCRGFDYSVFPVAMAEYTAGSSPFVMIFENLKGFQFSLFGSTFYFTSIIANALNIIVLTAALSVYNSSVYSNSRMLYGLAKQGNAPRFLLKLNNNHVPVMAILVSAAFAAICIIINKLIPEKALGILMSLVVSALIINWLMISITHLYFKKEKLKKRDESPWEIDQVRIQGKSLIPMGGGDFILALDAKLRKQLRKEEGNVVNLCLEHDVDFKIEMPEDLEVCIAQEDGLLEHFLSYTKAHQNYFINWLNTAKTETTRKQKRFGGVES
ncbi:hypothetical protein FQR65_LT15926 [Abscondita terminalis]|nr:hypothetical protein FQR65_LT15926 [Abscondita terminalis]